MATKETAARRSGRSSGETPRIYVASLADYVAGRHHGVWVDAVDVDEVRKAVGAMLKESRTPGAEEVMVHDFENFGAYRLSEYETDFSLICAIGSAIQERGLVFAAWLAHVGTPNDVADVARAVERFGEAYQGEWDSLADWAESFLEDTGTLKDVPESLRNYVDFASWAEDAAMNGDLFSIEADGRTHVFWRA